MSQHLKQLLKSKVCSENPALIFKQFRSILLFSKKKAKTQRHLKTENRDSVRDKEKSS